MLILTRKNKETIVIGENKEIKITVLNIRGNQVQIGVEAPKNISVHREEIFDRISMDKTEDEKV